MFVFKVRPKQTKNILNMKLWICPIYHFACLFIILFRFFFYNSCWISLDSCRHTPSDLQRSLDRNARLNFYLKSRVPILEPLAFTKSYPKVSNQFDIVLLVGLNRQICTYFLYTQPLGVKPLLGLKLGPRPGQEHDIDINGTLWELWRPGEGGGLNSHRGALTFSAEWNAWIRFSRAIFYVPKTMDFWTYGKQTTLIFAILSSKLIWPFRSKIICALTFLVEGLEYVNSFKCVI